MPGLRLLPRGLRRRLRRLRGDLRFALKRRRLAACAEIRVELIDGWGDADRALRDMTPAGEGRVGRVHFAKAHRAEPHYRLVLTRVPPGSRPPRANPPQRVWYALGEPPLEANRWMFRTPSRAARVHCVPLPTDWAAEMAAQNDYRAGPCPLRTWKIGQSLDALRAMPLPEEKPRVLSWITSRLATHPGHRYRLAFLERLRAALPFDLYGRGFERIADKWPALAPYRYSVAFENSVFDDYFTEKLADPILAGALPLYYGCRNLERHLPAGAFLRIDPEDPLVLERIRDWVSSDLWRERRPALEEAKALLLQRYNTFFRLAEAFEEDFPRTFGGARRRPA